MVASVAEASRREWSDRGPTARGGPGASRRIPLLENTAADMTRPAVPSRVLVQATPRPRSRWFYTGMGFVAVLVALVGFSGPIPGDVPGPHTFSPLVLLHAAVFGGWLALFIVQARLAATRRLAVHRRLGIASAALAVAMVVVGVRTAIVATRRGFPFVGDPLGMLVHPLGDLLSFTVLVGAGIWYRRRPDVHKRLLLLATVGALMNAPLTHLQLRLPAPLNANPLSFLLPMALLLSTSAVYDRVSRGRVHPVSLWGALVLFAWGNAREVLIRPSHAWHQVAVWLVR